MSTLVNNTSDTMYFTAQLSSGTAYESTIPPGGGWSIPSDVVAVLFHPKNS